MGIKNKSKLFCIFKSICFAKAKTSKTVFKTNLQILNLKKYLNTFTQILYKTPY